MSRDKDPFLENGLPSNPDAEKELLGGLLGLFESGHPNARSMLDFVRRRISGDTRWFSLKSNGVIWKAMCQLVDEDMHPGSVEISSHLNRKDLGQFAGLGSISALSSGVPFPDEKRLESILRLLSHSATLRALAYLTEDLRTRIARGDEPQDIANYVVAEVPKTCAAWTSAQPMRPIFHARDRDQEVEPAAPLVKGVAYRNQVTIVEGLAGSGKSHVAVDIAATASQGLRVLFVANESPEELAARLDAWEAFHVLATPGLHIMAEAVGLFDPARVGTLVATADELGGFDLVVIDVLSNEFGAAGKDETNENMAAAFASAYLIARALNCGVVVTTHTGWSGEHTRGGSQSYGSARRVFRVEQTDDVITVKVVKANVRRDFQDRKFRIVQLSPDRMEHPDPKRAEEYTVLIEAWKVTDGHGPLSPRQSELLVALAQPIFEAGARFVDLETHTRMAKSTISTVTNALMKRGLVNRSSGSIFTLSDNGQDVARVLIEAAENQSKNPIELALNSSPLNWQIETENSSDATPLVREGSLVVQPLFNESGSVSSFASPSLREATTELNELNNGPDGQKQGRAQVEQPGTAGRRLM